MRKRCQHCGEMFNAERRTRMFCTKSCSAKSRPREHYRTIGRHGWEKRHPDRIAAMRLAFERYAKDLDNWKAFQAGAIWQRQRSKVTGYSTARREGYAEGWEHCAKALQPFKSHGGQQYQGVRG